MKLFDELVHRCNKVTPLAQGGQKQVLSAEHHDYGPIVIKHGKFRYSTNLKRISREVKLLRQIDSPYYPQQYEFLIDPVNQEFLVVEERLDAVELTEVRDHFESDSQILTLLQHLVYALNILWQQNVVHRDIKPANILITSQDEPRIIDLGIARILDDKSLTASAAVRGPATPIYAAPEQLTNRKRMINIRTDFFLLGILALELMHQFHPFDPQFVGNQNSLIDNIMHGIYVKPDNARDVRLITFIERVLHVQPYKRFRTVDNLMKHLEMEL